MVVTAEAALAAAETAKALAAEALKPLMDAAAALVEASKALMANGCYKRRNHANRNLGKFGNSKIT